MVRSGDRFPTKNEVKCLWNSHSFRLFQVGDILYHILVSIYIIN